MPRWSLVKLSEAPCSVVIVSARLSRHKAGIVRRALTLGWILIAIKSDELLLELSQCPSIL